MKDPSAFATIKRARSLRERHADAPANAAHVLLVMATYADGKTGTSIRPGRQRIALEAGLSEAAVDRAIRWLIDHDELVRTYRGHRGSASCFSIKGVTADALYRESASLVTTKRVTGDAPPLRPLESSELRSSDERCPYCSGPLVHDPEQQVSACAGDCFYVEPWQVATSTSG